MSEDVVVCEVCGSSNVEEMVWRDANSHEITDTDTYEDDCWCNACGQHRNLIELEGYYDNILRYWKDVAEKNGIKGVITIDVAKKAAELLRGMDLCYMDVGYDNEDSVKSLKQALGESNADAVELFEKWSEDEWAKAIKHLREDTSYNTPVLTSRDIEVAKVILHPEEAPAHFRTIFLKWAITRRRNVSRDSLAPSRMYFRHRWAHVFANIPAGYNHFVAVLADILLMQAPKAVLAHYGPDKDKEILLKAFNIYSREYEPGEGQANEKEQMAEGIATIQYLNDVAKPQALQTPDCSWSFLERYGIKVPKWFQEKEKSWLSADGIPPAEEIDWDALAAAKRRGFPIGEEIKAPEQLTGSVPEVRGSCRTQSDLHGMIEFSPIKMRRPFEPVDFMFPVVPLTINLGSTEPKERLVDPGGLTDWINSPLSTIHDKRG